MNQLTQILLPALLAFLAGNSLGQMRERKKVKNDADKLGGFYFGNEVFKVRKEQ